MRSVRARARATGALAAAGATLAGGITYDVSFPAPARAAMETRVTLADPDVLVWGGTEFTFGTTVYDVNACGAPARRQPWFLPYIARPPGAGPASSVARACFTGDAMPDGPGAWTGEGSDLWAPGIIPLNGQFLLYYGALTPAGQRCIGHAVASTPAGPYTPHATPWACPAAGRWAIDGNPFVSGSKVYVAYRDDSVTTWPNSGISVVQVDANGWPHWDTRRTALTSKSLGGWVSSRAAEPVNVIENPVMVPWGGEWYLFFSGGPWDSPYYGTGVANCGPNPLPEQPCKILHTNDRPYWGSPDTAPLHWLPENHPGPGGMDIYTMPEGSHRAAWNWWDAKRRTRFVQNSSFGSLGPIPGGQQFVIGSG